MSERHRLTVVIVEVTDLERSTALYRDGFGVELHPGDNGVDDRWIGGVHSEISWTEGAYFHFALYAAKDAPTTGVQITFSVPSIEAAHATAVAAGAEVVHEPRPEPWGPTARYLDFDGNVVSLTESQPRG
jgi:predicted enzyme related to lactoylglutathione lyase